MIIQTPSTVIEVVGTRFEVEALQAFTTVNVREGNVRLKHLVDGNASRYSC
ncbi:MAG: FecR domain-containing protein [Pirellulales bacterium]